MKKVLLINDTRNESHIGSNEVIKNIFDLCEKNDMKIIGTLTRKEVDNWIPRISKRLKETDIILINGEGSTHDNPDWFKELCRNLYRYKDKKVVFFNAVWQDMKIHKTMREFFDQCEIISFRESLSAQEFLNTYGESDKVRVVPDVIFETIFDDRSIGYGDSVLDNKEDFKVHGNYFPMNSINNQCDVHSYMRWLKTLSLYVTGRFHGVCLAILMQTPFLAQKSNTHKIEGILKDMGCEYLLIEDPTDFEINLKDEIDSCQKMEDYIHSAKYHINQLFGDIGKL